MLYGVQSAGGGFYAQRASLPLGTGRHLHGRDYHSVPCFAVIILVVCSGGRLDRIWAVVYTLLLKGKE